MNQVKQKIKDSSVSIVCGDIRKHETIEKLYEEAKAKNIDVVLLDTAGRLHSNKNLMDELRKLIKVANPDLNIFVGESIAGNDIVEQVKLFNNEIGIDGIILAKADIDEKGGAAISVSYVTQKPILYLPLAFSSLTTGSYRSMVITMFYRIFMSAAFPSKLHNRAGPYWIKSALTKPASMRHGTKHSFFSTVALPTRSKTSFYRRHIPWPNSR